MYKKLLISIILGCMYFYSNPILDSKVKVGNNVENEIAVENSIVEVDETKEVENTIEIEAEPKIETKIEENKDKDLNNTIETKEKSNNIKIEKNNISENTKEEQKNTVDVVIENNKTINEATIEKVEETKEKEVITIDETSKKEEFIYNNAETLRMMNDINEIAKRNPDLWDANGNKLYKIEIDSGLIGKNRMNPYSTKQLEGVVLNVFPVTFQIYVVDYNKPGFATETRYYLDVKSF